MLGELLCQRPQPWEGDVSRRLRRDPPDPTALMELYDRTSAAVWAYARTRTRSRKAALDITRTAFVRAYEHPTLFDDRISMAARMLLVVHVLTEHPARRRQAPT